MKHCLSACRFCHYCFIAALFLTVGSYVAKGQNYPPKYQPPETRILFIFDASQSMAGTWQKESKISIARRVMIHIVDSLEQLPNVQMALRLYGHQSPVPPQNCKDTKLEVPFARDNAPLIRQKLRYIVPKGTTPIAYSLKWEVVIFHPKPTTAGILSFSSPMVLKNARVIPALFHLHCRKKVFS
jgi:hypothetical protein